MALIVPAPRRVLQSVARSRYSGRTKARTSRPTYLLQHVVLFAFSAKVKAKRQRSLSEGHQVKNVPTAQEAMRSAEDWAPHILFVDIGLPDVDGFALVRSFGAKGLLKAVYGAGVSGYGMPKDFAQVTESGFREYLVKAAEYHDVIRVVDQADS